MNTQENKKDILKMQISKNVIIGILSIALVAVSAVAIALAVDHEEHRNGKEYQGEQFMGDNHQETQQEMSDGTMVNNQEKDMGSTMNAMVSGLQGKTGDAFDKEFLSEMITHHQGAVDMAKAVLTTSNRPELIKLANDIIAAQTKEIDMMKGWQVAWFK